MPKVIKNLTNKPLYIHLNSKQLVALSPGEKSGKLQGVEIVNNKTVMKLKKLGVISISPFEGKEDNEKTARKIKKPEKTGEEMKVRKKEDGKGKTDT